MVNLVRLGRFVRGAGAVGLAIVLITLFCFFANVDRNASKKTQTDGIVAFSGEPQRFPAALRLLAGQRAQRLFLVGLTMPMWSRSFATSDPTSLPAASM